MDKRIDIIKDWLTNCFDLCKLVDDDCDSCIVDLLQVLSEVSK